MYACMHACMYARALQRARGRAVGGAAGRLQLLRRRAAARQERAQCRGVRVLVPRRVDERREGHRHVHAVALGRQRVHVRAQLLLGQREARCARELRHDLWEERQVALGARVRRAGGVVARVGLARDEVVVLREADDERRGVHGGVIGRAVALVGIEQLLGERHGLVPRGRERGLPRLDRRVPVADGPDVRGDRQHLLQHVAVLQQRVRARDDGAERVDGSRSVARQRRETAERHAAEDLADLVEPLRRRCGARGVRDGRDGGELLVHGALRVDHEGGGEGGEGEGGGGDEREAAHRELRV